MGKAIIFGCGEIGNVAYHIVKKQHKIIAYVDNNSFLWGTKKNNIDVIPPIKIMSILKKGPVEMFIAVAKSADIIRQVKSYGIEDFYVWGGGTFFFHSIDQKPFNYAINQHLKVDEKSILFVMNSVLGGIREYRLARVLKKAGFRIYLAYMMPITEMLDAGFIDVYEQIFQIGSLQDLKDLVNNNNFLLVHSSSEPEWATGYLIHANKKIIHECHDLGSSNVYMTPGQLAMEFIANVAADGVIYPSKRLRDDAIKKFDIPLKKTFVMENYISESMMPTESKEKLHCADGEIHSVYEGAISSGDELDKRFFEKIWLQIAKANIHVHFYTNHDIKYCQYLDSLHENIHYEGNLSSKQLATELTKYDLGLLIFNVNDRNRLYLECASPNKLYEYINAGIPVATSGITAYKKFVENSNIGKEIDLKENLYPQFKEISRIEVKNTILRQNKLTVESNEKDILEFFEQFL